MDPVTAILLSIFLGWGWMEVVEDDRPICQVVEVHNEKQILIPRYCEDVINQVSDKELSPD